MLGPGVHPRARGIVWSVQSGVVWGASGKRLGREA